MIEGINSSTMAGAPTKKPVSYLSISLASICFILISVILLYSEVPNVIGMLTG